MEKLAYSKKALGLIPLAFLLHNIEEIVMAKSFTPLFEHTDFTYTPFALGVVLISGIIIALFRASESFKMGKYFIHFNAGILVGMVLNVIVSHIGGAIYLKQYTPGLVTGILLYFPLAWYIYKNDIKPNLHSASLKKALIMVPIGFLALTVAMLYLALLLTPIIFS